jgi:hypothetical protein
VYVNDRYIGKKMMTNDYEHVADIDDFLHGRGFSGFTSRAEGAHYTICASTAEADNIANHLAAFLNNR